MARLFVVLVRFLIPGNFLLVNAFRSASFGDQPMHQGKRFKASVVVEPGRLGRYREVRSVEEASEVLQGRWPEARGKRYYAALRACRAALMDETPIHIARRAFIAAAEESRVLISDGRSA